MIPRQGEDIAFTVIDEAVVIVDPRDSRLYWLNGTASRIWELSDGRRTIEAIAARLCEEFEVEAEASLRDAREMVAALTDRGLMAAAEAKGDD